MTEAEHRVLTELAKKEFMTPADIGYALTTGRQYPLKPQGAGRVGGGFARKLVGKGLVQDVSFIRGGFPAYRITGAGRKALKEHVQ